MQLILVCVTDRTNQSGADLITNIRTLLSAACTQAREVRSKSGYSHMSPSQPVEDD
jgi:hypothetical protein